MLPIRCFTCGHILGDLQLELEEKFNEIDNDIKLKQKEKNELKKKVINELLPDRWLKRYCCRSRLITYVDAIKIII